MHKSTSSTVLNSYFMHKVFDLQNRSYVRKKYEKKINWYRQKHEKGKETTVLATAGISLHFP